MADETNLSGIDAKDASAPADQQVTQEVSFPNGNEPYEAIISLVITVNGQKFSMGSVFHYKNFVPKAEWSAEARAMRKDEHHIRSLIVAKARRNEDVSSLNIGIRSVYLNGSAASGKIKATDLTSL